MNRREAVQLVGVTLSKLFMPQISEFESERNNLALIATDSILECLIIQY